MTTARDNILARVRKALGKSPDRAADVGAAQRYIAEHRQGPRPTMPADLAKQFMQRATDMASTVEALAARDEVPSAVARYLAGLHWPPQLLEQRTTRGVCWPALADLEWAGAGLQIEARPTRGQ